MKRILIISLMLVIGLVGLVLVLGVVGAGMTSISVEDRYADKGIQRYDVELDILKGWNLVSSFVSPERLSGSEFAKSNIKAIYGFVPKTQKYIQVYPDKYEDITMELRTNHDFQDEELVMGAFWVYSKEEGMLKYSTDLILPMDEISLYEGWNFLSVTPDLAGKEFEETQGDCNISKVYIWDYVAQDWYQLNGFDDDALGYGVIVKVSSDCTLGSSGGGASPPGLPVNSGCTDSDGGKNYDIKGETCNEVDCRVDSCLKGVSGDFDSISEYYCKDNQRESVARSCDYKCEDGACITKPEKKCTDSDGGIDYNIKGKVITENIPSTGAYNEFEDYCLDSEEIMENYCGPGEGMYEGLEVAKASIYECPNGCENGACIQ